MDLWFDLLVTYSQPRLQYLRLNFNCTKQSLPAWWCEILQACFSKCLMHLVLPSVSWEPEQKTGHHLQRGQTPPHRAALILVCKVLQHTVQTNSLTSDETDVL